MEQITLTISKEEYYLSKVESFCYDLRNAMIDMSLKFPEISTFERYFRKLEDYDNVVYIIGLLHKCWCFAHPTYLFDTIPKDLSFEGVKNILSKYQSGSKRYGMDELNEEFSKKNTPLLLAYYKAYHKEGEMALCYEDYMESLYFSVEKKCSSYGINLESSFVIRTTIRTDKTPQQLKNAFSVFATEFKCCKDSEENLRIFLSLFDVTHSAAKGTIMWEDTGTKSKQASFASIYTIFSTLGVQMNQANRTIIAQHIICAEGAIMESQIKARSDSPKQKSLQDKIWIAINNQKEQQ